MGSKSGTSGVDGARNYLHPQTNARTHETVGPHVIVQGDGVYVVDAEGRRYLEGVSGLWCASLGFSEGRLADAAARQMRKLPYYHSFRHKANEPVLELARRLVALAPVPMGKVTFQCSGSEANDTALKLIWYYNNALGRPRKKKIICRTNGYHGTSITTASMTGLPAMHVDFDLPVDGIVRISNPHYYRNGRPGESEEAFADRLAHELEDAILREGPDTVAAMFAEPLMASGGVILPPRTYFQKVQQVLDRYDVLLVADEVICGFGRTGSMWGTETFGLRPDLLTCAKALSSAYFPISALLMSGRIAEVVGAQSEKLGNFTHGYTYGGHPVGAAVALETLDIYEEMDIVGRVREIAPAFQDELRSLADHPLVGEARGIGLAGAVEIVRDKASRAMFPAEWKVPMAVMDRAEAHGLIIRALGNAIGIAPPLIVTREEIGLLFARLRAALDDVWSRLRDSRQMQAA